MQNYIAELKDIIEDLNKHKHIPTHHFYELEHIILIKDVGFFQIGM